MRTAFLETVHASVSVATTRCCYQGVPKWTSLNRSLVIPHVTRCLMSMGWGIPYLTFPLPCGLSHDAFEVTPLPPTVNKQTPVKTLLLRDLFAGGNDERFDKDNETCGYYFEVTFYSINMITEQSSITFTRPWHVEQIYCELHLERKFLQLSKVCMMNLWFIFK